MVRAGRREPALRSSTEGEAQAQQKRTPFSWPAALGWLWAFSVLSRRSPWARRVPAGPLRWSSLPPPHPQQSTTLPGYVPAAPSFLPTVSSRWVSAEHGFYFGVLCTTSTHQQKHGEISPNHAKAVLFCEPYRAVLRAHSWRAQRPQGLNPRQPRAGHWTISSHWTISLGP